MKVTAGPARLRRLLLHRPGGQPAWPATYLPEGVVPPISALWVDEGHEAAGFGFLRRPGRRRGPDRSGQPPIEAAASQVGPGYAGVDSPPNAADVASVSSAPLGEIVERTLEVSDNQAAEVLARHVGLAERQEGPSRPAPLRCSQVLRRLGVPTAGDRLYDGSGLSRQNVLTTDSLAGVVRARHRRAHPELRQVLTGLPGRRVHRLAVLPVRRGTRRRPGPGAREDRHPHRGARPRRHRRRRERRPDGLRGGGRPGRPAENLEAQTLIDRIAGALGACSCGVGSTP